MSAKLARRHLHSFLALLLAFSAALTAPSSSAAPVVQRAHIAGHRDHDVTLVFGEQNQKLIAKMQEWEQRLAAHNVSVRFLLGAGELRRAALGMSSDGPGDVEVFIHVLNRNVTPLSLAQVYKDFREVGVNIPDELHALFGKEKKIDAYLKDARSFERGLPYKGDFGFFDGMGDTSLSQLVYSPSDNTLSGSAENLAHLAAGHITFLELAKTAKLTEPRRITHSAAKSVTVYKPLILKQALRSLRLKFDLLLGDNPNGFTMDDSFATPLRGFELYFAHAVPADLATYRLTREYLEHFVKLFKNRPDADLARMRTELETHHAELLKIFDGLGLDYRLLTSPRPAGMSPAEQAFAAVHRHAAFANILPFLKLPSFTLSNPFRSAANRKLLFNMARPKRQPDLELKLIPAALLERYSPALAFRVAHFDELERAAQSEVITDYVRALAIFHGNAVARIKEVTFSTELYPRFAFADISRLGAGDSRNLLQFLEDEWEAHSTATPTAPIEARSFNAAPLAKIAAALQASRKAQRQPVVIVDLDDTLFSSASRLAACLRSFDADSGTRYFAQLDLAELGRLGLEDFTYAHLARSGLDAAGIEDIYARLAEHVEAGRWSTQAYREELINENLADSIREWKAQGAEILFLTGRWEGDRRATLTQLASFGFTEERLIMSNHDEDVKTYKAREIRELLAARPNVDVVAVLDNDRKTIDLLQEQFPAMLALRVFSRFNAAGHEEVFLGLEQRDLFSVHGPQDLRSCEELLLPTQPKAEKKTKSKKSP